MGKIIRLTESDLTKLIKRIISESTEALEPMIGNDIGKISFLFKGGSATPISVNKRKWSPSYRNIILDEISKWLQESGTIDVIKKYYNNKEFKLPKFITINFGTSSSGNVDINSSVSEARRKYLTQLVIDSLKKLIPSGGPNDEVIAKLIINNTNNNYSPTQVDANFVDRRQMKADVNEQFGEIKVFSLIEKGMTPDKIRQVAGSLTNPIPTKKVMRPKDMIDKILAYFGSDEDEYDVYVDSEKIYDILSNLETYSDLIDLDNLFRSLKGTTLENFMNKYLECDHIENMYEIIQNILQDSQMDPNTVQVRNCQIILGQIGKQRRFGN